MKTGLICPTPHLDQYGHGEFHLLLDHLTNRKKYLWHYQEEKVQGAFICLDCSAHEFKIGAQSKNLLWHACMIPASEVVVPDVLWKGMDTLETSTRALDYWMENAEAREVFESFLPRVMLVPQGEDYQAWRTCLFGLMMKWQRVSRRYPQHFSQPPTIGVSKDYEVWEGGIAKLLREHIQPLVTYDEVQVHLLGWGRQLWELNSIAQEFPFIRSTDSAKPFAFAAKGIMLDPMHEPPPPYPGRDKDYFDLTLTEHQLKVAEHNVEVFKRLAAGKYSDVKGLLKEVRQ